MDSRLAGAVSQLLRRATRILRGAAARRCCFEYDAKPDHIDISIGSLDTPDAVHPTVALGTESRLAWCDAGLFDTITQHPSGSLDPPTDLAGIANFQHPDVPTSDEWVQTRRTT